MIIEKNIPLPNNKRANRTVGAPPKYSFGNLLPGDSFLHNTTDRKEVVRVQNAASKFSRGKNIKFVTRSSASGVRVWRVK